jgi:EF-P beta-lysylation protein EpmB
MPTEKPAMITQQAPSWQPESWSGQLDLIRSASELLDYLDLTPEQVSLAEAAGEHFPLRVPRAYAALMRRGDPADPLLRQVLTVADELLERPGFGTDPLEESEHSPVPGVLHKYRGRVLLVVTGACAVHCRYCFRRHFPYQEHLPTRQRLQTALDWLAQRGDIEEVILSGGDPLSLSDERLEMLHGALAELPHLRRLRIHTRLPVVEPARLSRRLERLLVSARFATVMVLHANHGRELSAGLAERLRPLAHSGVTLLNQAVLLQGVNDNVETLSALSERLFAAGVLPYYLHLLDPVAGAAHFQVDERRARSLHGRLRNRLPGYLVPALTREDPGEGAKTVLA